MDFVGHIHPVRTPVIANMAFNIVFLLQSPTDYPQGSQTLTFTTTHPTDQLVQLQAMFYVRTKHDARNKNQKYPMLHQYQTMKVCQLWNAPWLLVPCGKEHTQKKPQEPKTSQSTRSGFYIFRERVSYTEILVSRKKNKRFCINNQICCIGANPLCSTVSHKNLNQLS